MYIIYIISICVSFLVLPKQSIIDWVSHTTKIYNLVVLEAISLRSKRGQSCFFLGIPPWLADGCLPLMESSSLGVASVCVCVLTSFSITTHRIRASTNDFILF